MNVPQRRAAMTMDKRDFFARPLGEQEFIICNLPHCHGHPPSDIEEYGDDNLIIFECRCPECRRKWKVTTFVDFSNLG
jgi:hypothetical protein